MCRDQVRHRWRRNQHLPTKKQHVVSHKITLTVLIPPCLVIGYSGFFSAGKEEKAENPFVFSAIFCSPWTVVISTSKQKRNTWFHGNPLICEGFHRTHSSSYSNRFFGLFRWRERGETGKSCAFSAIFCSPWSVRISTSQKKSERVISSKIRTVFCI